MCEGLLWRTKVVLEWNLVEGVLRGYKWVKHPSCGMGFEAGCRPAVVVHEAFLLLGIEPG
jgi:hypothetical protein